MADGSQDRPRGLGSALTPERKALLARLLKQKGVACGGDAGIPRRGDDGPAPLTFAQEALWFLDQLEPDSALHNVPGAVRLTGRLDVSALERSLAEIVRRHESLRSTFVPRDGRPYQVPGPAPELTLAVTGLTHLARPEAEAEAVRIATAEAHHVFDLEAGPLFRAFLLRLDEAEHVLVLNFHHIVVDGWSMGVFTDELGRLYSAFGAGEPSPLPEPAIQLSDFAVWQRRALAGDKLEEHLSYWREKLSGALTGLTLPTDRPRPAVQSYRGKHCPVHLSARLSDELRELSKRNAVTPFMTLNAAFQVVLYHACRTIDVVIGSAVAHRNRKELEGLIGFLVNMLVLRTDLSGDPPFTQLLSRVRETTLGAWAHQDLPLTLIMKEVQPERDLSKNPLFQVQFSLLTPDHNPAVYGYGLSSGKIETLELPGLVMTPLDVQYENARYDVAVFLWDMPAGIQGTIEYASDLFDEETVAGLARRFEAVLRAVVRTPEATLAELCAGLEDSERKSQAAAEDTYAESMRSRLRSIKRRKSGDSR